MALRQPSLRDTLGLIVALATACGGRVAPNESSSGADGNPTPPDDPNACPHVVELRSFDRSIAPDEACSLAQAAPGCFSFYCQPSPAQCASACGDSAVNACALPSDYLSAYKKNGPTDLTCPARDASLRLHCAVTVWRGSKNSGCPVEGRRPAGLRPLDMRTAAKIADYLAESAWLEAASVVAFDELEADLQRLGASNELCLACAQAADDERRHATLVGALVRRFGGVALPLVVAPRTLRTRFELALENAVEGVVRETFGAAVALFRAQHASDPATRAAMTTIAEDECRHAELASSVADFLEADLSAVERDAIARARARAISDLSNVLQVDPPAAVRQALGVPTATEGRLLLEELVQRVWSVRAAA